MDFFRRAALLLALGIGSGCGARSAKPGAGSSSPGEHSPPASSKDASPAQSGRAPEDASALGGPGTAGLPGPPGSAAAPRSSDPRTREVEDRLFQTDGGRVVLRAIRVQGGWERWRRVAKISAAVEKEEPADRPPGSGGGPGAVSRQLAFSSQGGRVAVPQSPPELFLLASAFSFAGPHLRLEYLGVEVDGPSGETYDMVRVFEDRPGSTWSVGHFNRHSGVLERVLRPQAAGQTGAARFVRVDLSDYREFDGLWLATRWTIFLLPDRYARADLSRPLAEERLKISLESVENQER